MGTRALVLLKTSKGRYQAARINYEGYPEYTGKILNHFYQNKEAAVELISHGEIRLLLEASSFESYPDAHPTIEFTSDEELRQEMKLYDYCYIYEQQSWKILER